MSVEILIPVYNEGENILEVLGSLKRGVRTPFEVLIAYDREDDNTLPVLAANASHLPPYRLVRNRGAGVHGAVMSGFEASKTDAVITFPADDTYNAPLIDRMIAAHQSGADIVCASRFMKGGCMKGCPPLKAVLVRLSAFVLYHVARVPTHDPTNGFRLFSRRVFAGIPVESSQGWAFSIELLVKAARRGMRVVELPASWFERRKGKSRFKVFKWMPIYLRWFFYALDPFHRVK